MPHAKKQGWPRSEPLQKLWLISRTQLNSTGCWIWMNHRDRWGYGRTVIKGKGAGAHRLAYETFVDPIPAGMHVLHACDNPSCINPDHLSVGTHQQNMREASDRGRMNRPRLTHCKRGHELTDENRIWNRGKSKCRACENAAQRRHYHKIQAKKRAAARNVVDAQTKGVASENS